MYLLKFLWNKKVIPKHFQMTFNEFNIFSHNFDGDHNFLG